MTRFFFNNAATFDKPERVYFHSVNLRVRWFVDVDPRKFEFTNITWEGRHDHKPELKLLEGHMANEKEAEGGKQIAQRNSQDKVPLSPAVSDAAKTGQQNTFSNQGELEKSDQNAQGSSPAPKELPPAAARSGQTDQEKSPEQLLAVAYRYLAVNAEEAHRYGEACDFRFAAMQLKWPHPPQYKGMARLNETMLWVVHFFYWALCGYGEKVGRTALVLGLYVFIFGIAYYYVPFRSPNLSIQALSVAASPSPSASAPPAVQPTLPTTPVASISATPPIHSGKRKKKASSTSPTPSVPPTVAPSPSVSPTIAPTPMPLPDAIVYSLETGLLQKPEPRPQSFWARLLVGLELIAVPLQAALLALAIRRRFMK